jgi:hypothetical protein
MRRLSFRVFERAAVGHLVGSVEADLRILRQGGPRLHRGGQDGERKRTDQGSGEHAKGLM